MKFITLSIILISFTASAQKTIYGNNAEAGHYFNVGDAKLYYEIYGQGPPLVMLHDGVYGGIDEFAPLIGRFAERYQVICIATRGHGKSELGKGPTTWQQRADDAFKVIRSITKDSVTVFGFSDGGFTAYKLAALHPEVVKRMIILGAGDQPLPRAKEDIVNYTPEALLRQAQVYFSMRLGMMPEPNRWGESLQMMNKMYNEESISKETFFRIKCPTLVMGGDQDHPERLLTAFQNIKGSQLAIVPGCGRVVFYCNLTSLWEGITPFLGM